jgi:Fungal chitosanase of glycosyl hydrolase group 75/Bacterial SH3 domain
MKSFQVTSDGLNLRSTPSSASGDNIIAILSKGHVVFKVKEDTDKKWWKVKTSFGGESLEGYVAAKNLSAVSDAFIETLLKIGGIPIKRTVGESAFFFKSGMTINADGSPNAYHPENSGIDFLANAGFPGNWWALAVDNSGKPFVQGPRDPFPGYYVSTTALVDASFQKRDPQRYVNSLEVPYVVMPGNGDFRGATNVKVGDFAVAYNSKNNKISFAIYADVGPKNQIGEGSIALSRALGNEPLVNGRVRKGINGGITYLIFPNSGNGQPRSLADITSEASRLLEAWGGMERLKSI